MKLLPRWTATLLVLMLAACGGGGGGGSASATGSVQPPAASGASPPASTPTPSTPTPPAPPPTQTEAARFLAQATFGPTMPDIDRVVAIGYDGWLAEQFARPQTSHRATLDAVATTLPAGTNLGQNQFLESWWKQAARGDDALRQRAAWALAQIFVVSSLDSAVADHPLGVASYYDMLGEHAFGNFRNLLEAVTLHPMMGLYLSHLRNQKEDAASGRVPDENYAREAMQLFTIGLVELNRDGTPRLFDGRPRETYGNNDIAGLAKVLTGWSWYAGPNPGDRTDARFFGRNPNAERAWRPMQSYPQFHSTAEKRFLGATIPAQGAPDGPGSLKVALDTLFGHPNVGPFIGRQLIQRLVTSNPSPAYVARVTAAFDDNGSGVRGDLRAVWRAVLTDPEARGAAGLVDPQFGRLREPVQRLAHWMRSFGAQSDSGRFLMLTTDNPATSLGQTPMRAPSVFNFYRPGFVPPGSRIADAGLVAPEFQIANEVSVVGYLNTLRNVLANGAGSRPGGGSRNDIQPDYRAELALADDPSALLARVDLLLTAGSLPSARRNQIRDAVASVAIPAASGSNQAAIDAARRNRVNLAIFLTMASPEYLVQR
ncbi:MAG: DUF1800 family protein [Betaproteobacteria bacterium]